MIPASYHVSSIEKLPLLGPRTHSASLMSWAASVKAGRATGRQAYSICCSSEHVERPRTLAQVEGTGFQLPRRADRMGIVSRNLSSAGALTPCVAG